MQYEKSQDGTYNLRIREAELRAMQFMARFMVGLYRTRIFTGKFMRTVTRLNSQLDKVH